MRNKRTIMNPTALGWLIAIIMASIIIGIWGYFYLSGCQSILTQQGVDQTFLNESKMLIELTENSDGWESDGDPNRDREIRWGHFALKLENRSEWDFESLRFSYVIYRNCKRDGREFIETEAHPEKIGTLQSGETWNWKTNDKGSFKVPTEGFLNEVVGAVFQVYLRSADGVEIMREVRTPSNLSAKQYPWKSPPGSDNNAVVPSEVRLSQYSLDMINAGKRSPEDMFLYEADQYFNGRDGFERNIGKALWLYREAYKLEPSAKSAFGLGMIYTYRPPFKEVGRGLTFLEEAAEQNHHSACFMLAEFYSSNSDPKQRNEEKAIFFGLKAVELNPKSMRAHGSLAAAYARDGKFDEAIEHQEKSIEIYSSFRGANDAYKDSQQKKLVLYESRMPYPED